MPAKKTRAHLFCAAAAALCLLPVLLFAVCFTASRMGRSAGLYARCFHAFADTTHLGVTEERYNGIARELAQYLSGKDADLSLFNAREVTHLNDIRRLFRLFDRSWMLLIPAAVMGVIAIRTRDRKGFILGLVLTALAVGAMATYIALDFDGAFITMHRLLFTNDLWLLDPRTDLLICLMPEEMFISLAVRLALYVIPAWAAAAGCLGWAVCHARNQRFTGDRPGS